MTNIPLSVRYMVLSALGFALMGACVKTVSIRGIPILEIIAVRALISCLISYADIYRKKISCWGHNKLLLLTRGIIGTLGLICIFYAVSTLPLAESALLQYLYPIFTALLAFAFLKERVQRNTAVCILFSIIGLLAMIQPAFLFGHLAINPDPLPSLGVVAALLGALASGIAYVLVRHLSATEDASVIVFYFPFIALPVSCIFLGNNFVTPSGLSWILLLLVGIFTQVGQIGLTKAMQTENAGKATAYAYVQIVFSAILGILVFGEMPTIATLLGALFIIGGALINMYWK